MKKYKKWGCYEKMRPVQIEAIQAKNPIAYLPWGALEYHSYHNPIGLDGLKAYKLCIDLAKKVGGIVLPTVYQAANLIKSYPGVNFPKHSIEFSEKLIETTCQEYFEQLVQADFKIIVLLIGHAGEPHIDILKSTAKTFNKKYPKHHFWALAEFDILPDDLLVANHSAIGETSLQLYYAPKSVDLKSLPTDREITLIEDGVSGSDPRLATKKLGKKIAKKFVKQAAKQLKKISKKVA